MTAWFTSDLHLGHARVIEYSNRPFKSADEMDEALVHNWNDRVRPDDTVYVIGDVSFHKPEPTEHLLRRLVGRKRLILGNHDKRMHPQSLRQFESVALMETAKIDDPDAENGVQRIVLCHYAMRTWDQMHRGAWHLYGHSHGTLRDDPYMKAFDVGVDCWGYAPIDYARVKDVMSRKLPWRPVDHHEGRK